MHVPGTRLLGVLALAACTADQPVAPAPHAAEIRGSAPPSGPVTTPVAPTPAVAPAPPSAPPPTPPVAPGPPAEPAPPSPGACDLGGTWKLELILDEDGCGSRGNEHVELALAFVAGDRPTVASAARASGAAGTFAGLLPALRAAPYAVPGVACGVRLELRPPAGPTHGEVLLRRDATGLHGQGTLWAAKAGEPCRQFFSVFGERSAAAPAAWSALAAGPAQELPAPTPAGSELAAAARKLPAAPLFGPRVSGTPAVKLAGSVVAYVAAVVGEPRAVKLYEVGCTAATDPDARCVAVVADPCADDLRAGEDCEGMYLTAVVNITTGKLDRADAGNYPVESQADIEDRLEMAP